MNKQISGCRKIYECSWLFSFNHLENIYTRREANIDKMSIDWMMTNGESFTPLKITIILARQNALWASICHIIIKMIIFSTAHACDLLCAAKLMSLQSTNVVRRMSNQPFHLPTVMSVLLKIWQNHFNLSTSTSECVIKLPKYLFDEITLQSIICKRYAGKLIW